MENNLYVIVRNDLPRSQKAVQAIHASAELILRKDSLCWNNGTVVYLKVRDENELLNLEDSIKKRGIEYSYFREPDLGHEMTAIALIGYKVLFF